MFQKLHHVAYRCRDAQETVEFYTKVLGLKYAAGHQSPEGARPYGEEVDLIHIFFDPNGIRLEMTARTEAPGELDQMEQAAAGALATWNARKQRKYGVPA